MVRKNICCLWLLCFAFIFVSCAKDSTAAPTDTIVPPTATNTRISPTSTVGLPSSSSDQGLIVFYSHRDGNIELYTMMPDGSDQRRITVNEVDDYSPVWSPDGKRIAFISNRDDLNPTTCSHDCLFQLYLINADGSDEHKLISTEFSTQHPDWHPDGSKISFDSENNLDGDIYVVNPDGSNLQLLIEDGYWADWSPDGTQLVFCSKRDGNVEIYIADADGENQRRLTDNPRLEFFPAWSPNGKWIAFAVWEEKQIFFIDVEEGSEQRLNIQLNSENPTWSPDGSHLAFQSSSEGNFEIYTINIEDALQGNEGPISHRLTNNQVGDLWPSWGPATAP